MLPVLKFLRYSNRSDHLPVLLRVQYFDVIFTQNSKIKLIWSSIWWTVHSDGNGLHITTYYSDANDFHPRHDLAPHPLQPTIWENTFLTVLMPSCTASSNSLSTICCWIAENISIKLGILWVKKCACVISVCIFVDVSWEIGSWHWNYTGIDEYVNINQDSLNHIHIKEHTYTHIHTHAHIHTYTHIHTHMCTHTKTQASYPPSDQSLTCMHGVHICCALQGRRYIVLQTQNNTKYGHKVIKRGR